mgnify:CR=1 FL=1
MFSVLAGSLLHQFLEYADKTVGRIEAGLETDIGYRIICFDQHLSGLLVPKAG